MIEDAHHMGLQLMAILWQADWSHLAAPARKALETLSSQHSHVMFLCLDVEGSPENTQFAFEKVRSISSHGLAAHAPAVY